MNFRIVFKRRGSIISWAPSTSPLRCLISKSACPRAHSPALAHLCLREKCRLHSATRHEQQPPSPHPCPMSWACATLPSPCPVSLPARDQLLSPLTWATALPASPASCGHPSHPQRDPRKYTRVTVPLPVMMSCPPPTSSLLWPPCGPWPPATLALKSSSGEVHSVPLHSRCTTCLPHCLSLTLSCQLAVPTTEKLAQRPPA